MRKPIRTILALSFLATYALVGCSPTPNHLNNSAMTESDARVYCNQQQTFNRTLRDSVFARAVRAGRSTKHLQTLDYTERRISPEKLREENTLILSKLYSIKNHERAENARMLDQNAKIVKQNNGLPEYNPSFHLTKHIEDTVLVQTFNLEISRDGKRQTPLSYQKLIIKNTGGITSLIVPGEGYSSGVFLKLDYTSYHNIAPDSLLKRFNMYPEVKSSQRVEIPCDGIVTRLY